MITKKTINPQKESTAYRYQIFLVGTISSRMFSSYTFKFEVNEKVGMLKNRSKPVNTYKN